MADPKIKLKRSAVSGKIPTTDQLPLGEVALNTYDGYLYASKNVGIGTTVITINPFRVGTGTDNYDAYFTAGNVGIGSTLPTSKLDVIGNVNISGVVTASSFVGDASGLTNIPAGAQGAQGAQGSLNILPAHVVTSFTATGGQTTFSVEYTVGQIDVYLNGIRLHEGEYTATNGTSVILLVGTSTGDILDVVETTLGQGAQGAQGTDGPVGAQGAQGSLTTTPAHDVTSITASQGQTTFNVSYTVGQIDVYLNGVRLSDADITASNGTSIVLNTAANLGDILDVVETTLGQGPQGAQGSVGSQGATGTFVGTPARTETSFTATQGQTTFSISYTVGYIDVYLNGIRLTSEDFTATNGSSIILISGAEEGDVLDIVESDQGVGPQGVQGPQGIQGLTGTFSGTPAKTVTSATATAGQTTFSLSYEVGYLDVFLNGIRLNSGEFTATSGSSVILNSGASLGDVLDFVEMNQGVGAQGAVGAQGLSGVSYSRNSTSFTASQGQTTFSISYTVDLIDVFLNGVRLSSADYTASDGSSVVLSKEANLNDIIDIITFATAGITGAQGSQGTTGEGSQGTTGTQGTQGANGATGEQGTTGAQGTSGEGLSAGSANQVIFRNSSNDVAGSGNLTFNGTNLTISGITSTGNLNIVGIATANQFFGDGSGLSGVGGESDITSSLFS
jgi:collagen type I alpha